MWIKLVGVFIFLAIGFMLPEIFKLDKKMEFVSEVTGIEFINCVLEDNHCDAGDYHLALIDGAFEALELTSFSLKKGGSDIDGEILVTSDDKQFGTLRSQRNSQTFEVLIPYCSNSIMKVIVIDLDSKVGVVINHLN
ncbi:hypothetical protein [Vibrio maerlii]|uniref:hypothetical protein n=1 Tax=Vibrio maerlii TaxID=2231648 RepID=UPI000E3B9E64|nr:hypothetical protein [Vibrio maerlii]